MERKKLLKEVINEVLERKIQGNNETCIEPFAYTDEEGNVIDYKEMHDIMEESLLGLDEEFDIEINEDAIIYDELENQVKEIAEDINPINSDLMLEVNYGERVLVDKINCNIKYIPLLDTYFITNRDILIVQVTVTDAMGDVNEVEIAALVKMEEKYVLCTMKVDELDALGLIRVHNNYDELEMNNVEFRGLTAKLHVEELEELFKDYEFEEEKYSLTTEL